MSFKIYGIVAATRDLVHIFSSFQVVSYSKRHLCLYNFFITHWKLVSPSWNYSGVNFNYSVIHFNSKHQL